jgi:hypothetical protein
MKIYSYIYVSVYVRARNSIKISILLGYLEYNFSIFSLLCNRLIHKITIISGTIAVGLFLLRILEVVGSGLGLRSCLLIDVLHAFPYSPQAYAWIVPQGRPQPDLSASFSVSSVAHCTVLYLLDVWA